MRAALRYHAKHLLVFYGRDSRQTFWYWFLLLFIVNIAAGMAMAVPMTINAMVAGIHAAKGGDEAAAQAAMMTQMAAMMGRLIALSIAIGVANVLLIAAPLVRRIHDSANSGLWAILAAVIYLISLGLAWSRSTDSVALMRRLAAAQNPDVALQMQGQMAWDALLGYVPIVMVIGFGLLKSTPGPNRYGTEPARF
jgi:uncharacterized membrane protein YhaH (DUF805 family)